MEIQFIYQLISLVFGIGATALLYQLLVVKTYKSNEYSLQRQIDKMTEELSFERGIKEELGSEYSAAKRDLEHAKTKLDEQKGELQKLNEQLTKDFENIANKVVYHNSKVMQEKHEEKLLAMLTPFKDKIERFEKKVEDTHKESIKDSQSLKEQLLQLKELNKSIGDEAKNLTSALKGDKKMQGDWGEHKLERILQAAGLEKETHYRKQVNLKDEFNNNLRPDYIIYLPDDKNLVIDSKVSLVAYEKYFSADDDAEMNQAVASHIKNVREHIMRLSSVNYAELTGVNSPDYVIMYMPIDGALGLAMTEDSSLFEYALNKNIVLVSNNTLLATLKTVSFIWRQDLQNKNAIEIARQGGALYDKLAGFVETLLQVGKKIEMAQTDYEKAVNQLSEGKGNLVRRAEQLRQLGIKTTKTLPSNLVDKSED